MSRYDVIVIGGGIAGTVCGNYLARAGKKTLLLEQNHQTGGNMSGFSRKGFYFDGGDQSFESLGIVFPILEELGLFDPQEWVKADFRMVSRDFDFVIEDLDQVEDALRTAFPREPGIKPLFGQIKEVSRFLDAFYTPFEFPLLNDFKLRRGASLLPWLGKLKRWSTFDYRRKACSVIENPELRHWFTNIGYYQMPFLFFAGFWHIWAKDYWYPKGGMQGFHNRLAAAFTDAGGELKCNTLVTAIDHQGDRAVAVRCAGGELYEATEIVYAGDYKELLRGLLREDLFPARRREKLLSTKLTEEIVSVYLGLDMSSEELAALCGAHHPFYFPNYDVIFPDEKSPGEIHSRMWVALNQYGLANPGSAPEGKGTLVLQTYSSYDWQNLWGNGSEEFPRNDAYREMKEKVAGELISTAENIIPGLRQKVVYQEVGTPLSLRRYTRNSNGSTGGWCYREDISPVFAPPGMNLFRTPLRNLHAAGHYALWPGGVISAALSGRLIANRLTGKRLLAPIRAATG
ncbi:MAG: phytoene desaturase family protein [Spirochaetaceae bacterium]